MLAGSTMARMGLAAFVSGAAAGPLLIVSLLLGALVAGAAHDPGGEASSPNILLPAMWMGVKGGAFFATLPSFIAGAAMTGFSFRFEAARRAPAWAAAGAAIGFGFWPLAELMLGGFRYAAGVLEWAPLLAFLLSGAAAALVFRGVMRLTGRLCAIDDPWPTTEDRR